MPATQVPWGPSLVRLNPWFPGQVGGVPGADSETGLRLDTNGAIFYVDPNHVDANDNKDGTDPTSPMATIEGALGKCAAYNNDTIIVAPSSYWTYGNLAVGRATPINETVTVSVPGVRIIGLMQSSNLGVPWVPTANNDVLITVNAMDVIIEGFNFWDDGYTGVAAIYSDWDAPPYGENLTVRNCFFYGLAYGIRMDYTWNNHIHDNWFQSITTAAINSVDTHGDPDFAIIENNKFYDCTAAIDLEDTDDCIIHANIIKEDPTGAANYIDLNGGANGIVSDNWLGCTLAQYPVTCTDGAGTYLWVNNHCVDGDTVANA